MPFDDVLKKLRTEKGLTQEELAKNTNLSKSVISMYENGKRKPSFEVLELFADYFNVDMNTLTDTLTDTKQTPAPDLPALTAKDEREIAKDLEAMINNLDSDSAMAAYGGTVEDEEDRELLKASLLTSMRLAKQIAKKKYTPKKYRKEE